MSKLNIKQLNNELMKEANIINNKLKSIAEKYDFDITPNFTEITEDEIINFKDTYPNFLLK